MISIGNGLIDILYGLPFSPGCKAELSYSCQVSSDFLAPVKVQPFCPVWEYIKSLSQKFFCQFANQLRCNYSQFPGNPTYSVINPCYRPFNGQIGQGGESPDFLHLSYQPSILQARHLRVIFRRTCSSISQLEKNFLHSIKMNAWRCLARLHPRQPPVQHPT